jgi:hypothetical protein
MTGRWARLAQGGAIAAAVLAIQAPVLKETFLQKLLRIAGLTAAPTQMRGPADEVLRGNIFIVPVGGGSPTALTTDGGYCSPVFSLSEGTTRSRTTPLSVCPLVAGPPPECSRRSAS